MSNPVTADSETLESPQVIPGRRRLPRGSTSLPREVVDKEQRKRLVAAMARVVAEKGYANATVGDVIGSAGVSRATFYSLFVDKEECFLYGLKKLSDAHLSEYKAAIFGAGALPDRLLVATTAYFRRIGADAALAKAFILEAQGATARSRDAFTASQKQLQAFLQQWLDEVMEMYPQVAARNRADIVLVMNGVSGYVFNHILESRSFSEIEIHAVLRFVFSGLGLYGWASHVEATGLIGGSLGCPTQR